MVQDVLSSTDDEVFTSYEFAVSGLGQGCLPVGRRGQLDCLRESDVGQQQGQGTLSFLSGAGHVDLSLHDLQFVPLGRPPGREAIYIEPLRFGLRLCPPAKMGFR